MQATKFYKALKEQGKVVEMEIYPRGGHCDLRAGDRAGDHAPQPRLVPEVASASVTGRIAVSGEPVTPTCDTSGH